MKLKNDCIHCINNRIIEEIKFIPAFWFLYHIITRKNCVFVEEGPSREQKNKTVTELEGPLKDFFCIDFENKVINPVGKKVTLLSYISRGNKQNRQVLGRPTDDSLSSSETHLTSSKSAKFLPGNKPKFFLLVVMWCWRTIRWRFSRFMRPDDFTALIMVQGIGLHSLQLPLYSPKFTVYSQSLQMYPFLSLWP